MKKQILFILVLVCAIVRSQDSSGDSSSTGESAETLPSISQELPELSPKSPEVTEFIKYGNTSSRKLNINIPIYTV